MSLLATIKADLLQARKDKNQSVRGVLTTLLGEATAVGKNDGNRDTTDTEVLAIIKSFIKKLNETIAHANERGVDVTPFENERDVLERYMPQQITEDQLITEVTDYINGLRDIMDQVSLKQMGAVMAHLTTKFPDQFDKKRASQYIREQLV